MSDPEPKIIIKIKADEEMLAEGWTQEELDDLEYLLSHGLMCGTPQGAAKSRQKQNRKQKNN
ncbi:MAG: hypothetical protein ACYC63_20115 [Armatimonadota bacterium]